MNSTKFTKTSNARQPTRTLLLPDWCFFLPIFSAILRSSFLPNFLEEMESLKPKLPSASREENREAKLS